MGKDWERFRAQEKRDMEAMARSISSPLHFSTKIPRGTCCNTGYPPCDLCSNAARLVVQEYGPMLERRFVEQVGRMFDVPTGWSPPCSD